MPSYRTPAVYVEEISTLPPSVAEVSTAIPAFIGYTERGSGVARINTLLEFEQRFGGPSRSKFTVTTRPEDPGKPAGPRVIASISRDAATAFGLYYSISLFFKNGGGTCYISSVGNYDATPEAAHFEAGLAALEKEDEPTLLVLSDATLLDQAAYGPLCAAALAQCKKLGDRFAILDVKDGDTDAFRTGVGANNLMYGAAYHPYVLTTINYQYADADVTITTGAEDGATTLAAIKSGDKPETALYNAVRTALTSERVTLPSSAAVAGVYAQTDRERGVWKAPANVSLAAVIGPVAKITNEEQEGLNVDANAGKSINAVRAFTGKGTLVWGARTLAGNDNEWRYVPVRRLFITIEESCQKATSFAVFEPNDATTWLKVKGMIESYLYGLWEKGALAGGKPESAYFVNVGLGKTMTAQDVLEGRMNVEIGVAAVRPAEFIVLRFSHKLQEA
ncbi:MAG: phage tail sheath family protein [Myxococcales bacterium]|nr:phage tail sheath family protein [Myxococcales bacterium]